MNVDQLTVVASAVGAIGVAPTMLFLVWRSYTEKLDTIIEELNELDKSVALLMAAVQRVNDKA